jgi:hypothetical protein
MKPCLVKIRAPRESAKRNHQGLENRLLTPICVVGEPLERRERVGVGPYESHRWNTNCTLSPA